MSRRKSTNKDKKSSYKGPYHKNPDITFHTVKKSMVTQTDGPTVDGFSTIDSTTETEQSNEVNTKTTDEKRPTKAKNRKSKLSIDAIAGIVFTIIFTIISVVIGIVVFNHSNKFVSVEKDIEYIQKKTDESSVKIENIEEKTTSIDRKIDILKLKSEIEQKKK